MDRAIAIVKLSGLLLRLEIARRRKTPVLASEGLVMRKYELGGRMRWVPSYILPIC